MKKLLLAFAVLFSCLNQASATHLMGGQITSQNLGGLTYQITLTAYRDTVGIPMYLTTQIHYEDSVSGFDSVRTVAVSPAVSIGNGVEMYKYIDTITFPSAGTYRIWSEDCCRNCALLNMTSPCSESFHLNNILLADSTNSSPEFLNIPITLAQLNVPFSYNPLPFDADGDSIAWELDVPLSMNGALVLGYVLPSSDSLVPFTMDQVTGEITFLPNMAGNFEVSVKVKEYRNGVEIGFIRRDMQILVMPSPNQAPRLSLTSTSSPYSGKNYTIAPGTAFNFTVIADDLDMNAPYLNASGEAFMLGNPPVFTTTSTTGITTATLTWSPTAAEARPQPYRIGLRVEDTYGPYIFMNDITLYLRVGNFTGVSEVDNAVGFQVYPNPVTNGEIALSFRTAGASPVSIEILNLAGQSVKRIENAVRGEGNHLVNVRDLNLGQGMYLVRLMQDGKQLDATRFTVR